jgi:hypothetical protein
MASPILSTTGFLRETDLIGRVAVTKAEAAANRRAGRRGRRPREAKPAIVPISSATLWRWIKLGKFPRPVRLGDGVTAWPIESVRAWLISR